MLTVFASQIGVCLFQVGGGGLLYPLTKGYLSHSYYISSLIRQSYFLEKQSKKSRSISKDGSRSLGLFYKGKTNLKAKLHQTDLDI